MKIKSYDELMGEVSTLYGNRSNPDPTNPVLIEGEKVLKILDEKPDLGPIQKRCILISFLSNYYNKEMLN